MYNILFWATRTAKATRFMHNKDSFSKLGLSDIDISATYASFTFYLPTSRVTVIQTSLVKDF